MRRVLIAILFAGAFIAGSPGVHAQGDGGYRLVPNWPKLPAGVYFGLKDAPPPPAERDAQAAARRARGGAAGGGGEQNAGPTNQPGISGLAIDAQDHIYVFNRGVKPVMVFDRDGNLILSGADREINGKTINPSWQHSGEQTILDVPKFDFNWQIQYELAEPLHIPAGSKILGIGKYDNSPKNRWNPSPNLEVFWSEQSWDEMYQPFTEYSVDSQVLGDMTFTKTPQPKQQ